MSDDDCFTYLCTAVVVLFILALFWQLIVIFFVIVFVVIFAFWIYGLISDRSTKTRSYKDSAQRDWTSYDHEIYGKQHLEDELYEEDEYEEAPKRGSRTYIDPNGYERYSDSRRLKHIHIAEVYVVRRKLRDDEVVHHKNWNKLDNRASNLRVMTWWEHRDLHDR